MGCLNGDCFEFGILLSMRAAVNLWRDRLCIYIIKVLQYMSIPCRSSRFTAAYQQMSSWDHVYQ